MLKVLLANLEPALFGSRLPLQEIPPNLCRLTKEIMGNTVSRVNTSTLKTLFLKIFTLDEGLQKVELK